MGYLKKRKQDALKRLSGHDLSESEKDELFWIKLKEGLLVFERLYNHETWELFHTYAAKYPEIGALQDALTEADLLIEKLGKGGRN